MPLTPVSVISGGSRTASDASRPTPSEAKIEPRCGVATYTTRVTNGSGRKNTDRVTTSRVCGPSRTVSKGTWAIEYQIAVPESTTCILACKPPMLWPTSTRCLSAGSRPSGSSPATAAVSCRRRLAEICRNDAPVGS